MEMIEFSAIEKEMANFVSGGINILCATSVVEVGVNVPNATSIIIEGAAIPHANPLNPMIGR